MQLGDGGYKSRVVGKSLREVATAAVFCETYGMDANARQPVTPSPEFWRWVAEFGFGEYLKNGKGFFLAVAPLEYLDAQGQRQRAEMAYVPFDPLPSNHVFVARVKDAVQQYDPCTSVVVAVHDADTRLIVLVVGADELGVAPVDAYREWCVRTGHGRLIPGEVLLLKRPIEGPDHVEPGLYVFLNRAGAWMTFRRAGLDQNAVVQLTNEDVRVHWDYEECFSDSPKAILRLSAVGQKKKRRKDKG